jgi:two-component system NarL family sensor kinase
MLGYEPMALSGRTLVDLAAQGWREAAEVASARVRYGATEDFSLVLQGRSGRLSLIEMVPQPAAARLAGAHAFLLEWTNGRPRRHGALDDPLQHLTVSLMRRRERERLHVARRLHDDLAPTLAVAKYLIEDAAQRSARGERGEACELLVQAATSLRHVVTELRNISNALRPRLLDDLGLVPTLEWFGRGFQEAHPAISMVRVLTASEGRIPAELKADMFRIVQDALGNVARHAHATEVRLALIEEAGELRLSVDDNGLGFDAASAFQPGRPGVGLLSMRKRVRSTGGRFMLESRPEAGTRVSAVWPLASVQLGSQNGGSPYYPDSAGGDPIQR